MVEQGQTFDVGSREAAIASRKPAETKFERRRRELADAALSTLGQMGYTNASLREIAQKSSFSHGVFHYYFTDKSDLICCAVRQYKARCATRYDDIVETAQSREELVSRLCEKLGYTLRFENDMHRLWYDLRAEALFAEDFRNDILAIDKLLEDMVWRIVTKYCELGQGRPELSPVLAYALFDGLFQRHVLGTISSGPFGEPGVLEDNVRELMGKLALPVAD